jgi:chlorobactene glucosyltransferase
VIYLAIFILSALSVIAAITLLNTFTFPRLRKPTSVDAPYVSVLIPARNEAAVIGETVRRSLAQDYPRFEVILLDDDSSDNTYELASQAAAGDSRLQVVRGILLPPGWAGKNWACQQLSDLASGELLVFSDADVRWEASGLGAMVACIQRYQADTFTVWPTQETVTWAERLVVPLMMFSIVSYLPEIAVRKIPWASFAAANGQCLAFRREAYQKLGGHAAVKNEIVEDIVLAKKAKKVGLRLVMALGEGLVHGRMYRDWRTVREGFGKNILAGHGGNPFFLLVSTVFHWLLFIIPWIWLVGSFLAPSTPGWWGMPLAAIALGLGARALSATVSRHRLLDALLLPVSVLLMTVIAAQSLWWHYTQGGPTWKGRVVSTGKSRHA